LHHGHVPHCKEWEDVGGGTTPNHRKTYSDRCKEMSIDPDVPDNACEQFANDAVNALGLGSARYSTSFDVTVTLEYREGKDSSCKSGKRQWLQYVQKTVITAVGECQCKTCGGEKDTTKDKDCTPKITESETSYIIKGGCI